MTMQYDGRNEVIEAIKSGRAKMRPRWYFVLHATLVITAVVILFLILLYIASFTVFALHVSGAWFTPDFGIAGWHALFDALPWLLISLLAVFVLALALLVRRYPAGYQWPLVYSLLALLFVVIGGGLIIAQTSFSNAIFSNGIEEKLPFVGGFYSGFGIPDLSNIHHGTITAFIDGGFIMDDLRGRTLTVLMSSTTSLPYGNEFALGDSVIVFGERLPDATIYAAGVERVQ